MWICPWTMLLFQTNPSKHFHFGVLIRLLWICNMKSHCYKVDESSILLQKWWCISTAEMRKNNVIQYTFVSFYRFLPLTNTNTFICIVDQSSYSEIVPIIVFMLYNIAFSSISPKNNHFNYNSISQNHQFYCSSVDVKVCLVRRLYNHSGFRQLILNDKYIASISFLDFWISIN